jgi:hypothetical protein
MRIKVNSFYNLYWIVVVYAINSIILIQDGRFNPDPHHDGLIFAGAIASSEGSIPNRDFFSQYGPLTPYLQGIFLNLTSPNLISLRLFMGLLSALNGTIIYLILSKVFTRSFGLLVSLIWVLELSAQIPWPSILSTSLILLAVLLIIDISQEGNAVTESRNRILAGGFLLGVLIFVRIHNVVFLFLIVTFLVIRKFKDSVFLVLLLLGNSIGLLTGLVVLYLTESLPEFIQQCIIWPIFKYGSAELNKSYVVGLMWFPLISLLSVLYISVMHNFSTSSAKRIRIFTLIFLLMFWLAISYSFFIPREGYLSLRNPIVLYIDASNNFVHLIGFFSVGIVIFFSAASLLLKNRPKNTTLLAIVAMGTLTQLYPLYDQVHLWFITPVLLVCSALFIQQVPYRRVDSKTTILFFAPFIVLLSALSIQHWSNGTTHFKSEILSGMKGNPASVETIDGTIKMLELNVKGEKLKFDCANGLYAAFRGKYQSSDRNYVDWAPGFSPAESGEKYFLCDISGVDYKKELKGSSEIAKFSYSSAGETYYNAILIRK